MNIRIEGGKHLRKTQSSLPSHSKQDAIVYNFSGDGQSLNEARCLGDRTGDPNRQAIAPPLDHLVLDDRGYLGRQACFHDGYCMSVDTRVYSMWNKLYSIVLSRPKEAR